METLGQKIKQIRKKLKLNQQDFAFKIGLESAVAVSNYENDQRSPDKNKLILISKLGNISLDELLTGEYKENQIGTAGHIIKDTESPYEPILSDHKINIEEAIGKAYTVLSAGTALSVALYMNIQQFATALNTGHALQFCQDQMKDMQAQIDVLKQQVDRLTAAPITAEGQGDGSAKKAM